MRYVCHFWVTLLIFVLPAAAADSSDERASEYAATLEANVDLQKPADRRGQTFNWLLDETGKQIAELSCLSAMPFSEGLSSITSNSGQNGYIDRAGKVVIPIQFGNSRNFSNGLAWVWTNSREDGYIDRSGNQVIKNKDFYEGQEFSENLAAVRVRISPSEVDDGRIGGENLPGKWGFIRRDGKIVVKPQYDQAEAFHQDRAAVCINKQWFFIDQAACQIGKQYNEVGYFSESLAPVCTKGKWGFIDLNGKLAIPQTFAHARSFASGMAAVRIGDHYGFVDKSGSITISPQFNDARDFSQGLCAVRSKSGAWGFIDSHGKLVIPPAFDEAESFSCGLAMVRHGQKFGFIDGKGKYVVEPKYDYARSYSENRAVVQSKNWNHPIMRSSLLGLHLKGLRVHKDATSPTGVYIPKNLDDALKELDEMLPPAAKHDISIIKKEEMLYYHHGFGTWLRNNWGLWKGLRLAKYLQNVGFLHPDDMSGTILDSYWAKVHGEQNDIAAQAENYKAYWNKMRPMVDASVKLPASIMDGTLHDIVGKPVDLKNLVKKGSVTVLALCSDSDMHSPKLIEMLDQLTSVYRGKNVNLIAATTKGDVGGVEMVIGKIEAGKVLRPKDVKTSRPEAMRCLRVTADKRLFQEIRRLFKLDSLVIPQTLVIQRDGTIIKRFNGFDTRTKANLKMIIEKNRTLEM